LRAPGSTVLPSHDSPADLAEIINSVLKANPANSAVKAKLSTTLAQTSQLKIASPVALMQVARAQTALGDHAKALENTQKVLAITPDSTAALQLPDSIKARIATPSQ